MPFCQSGFCCVEPIAANVAEETMKHARAISPDGEGFVVDAFGNALGNRDATTRVLHVLPQLLVPMSVSSWLDSSYVDLEVISSFPLVPEGGVRVRQPMPNTRYFIGGSADIRYGWFVPLPDGLSTIEVEFRWLLHQACDSRLVETEDYEVRHKMNITLIEGGAGNTYTMDAVCWPKEHRVGRFNRLYAWMGVTDNDPPPDGTANRSVSTTQYRRDDRGRPLDGQLIEEVVELPSIRLDQLWPVHEFGHEQIHELNHRGSFTVFKDLHEDNATCCCPTDIFLQAIQLARTISFGQGSDYDDRCEEHPANRLLAEWWQEARPDLIKLPVGFAMPWVRVEDDDRYWCGYYETPDEPMRNFVKSKTSQARVSDMVMLMFYARKEHFVAYKCGYTLVLANGQTDSEISGVELAECDEAWYALEALHGFPSRFPEAWDALSLKSTPKDLL